MLSRRQVITSTVQSALAICSMSLLSGCSRDQDVEQTRQSPLHEYAAGMEGISYIGVLCIEKNGFDFATPTAELQSLLTERLQSQFTSTGVDGSFQQQLEVLVRKDFADNRLVDVDGWQLSETECRLLALAAALQGHRQPKTLDMNEPRISQIAEVQAWGPQSTIQGQTFNEQVDGHSGLWFKADGAPASAVIVFAGKNQLTQVYPDVLTSGLRGQFMQEVINSPGEYSVAIYDKSLNLIQPLGEFQVLEANQPAQIMSDAEFADCSVNAWGPRHSKTGEPFNPQPGGESAFWVKTNCALEGSTLILNGAPLFTSAGQDLLTALVPDGHRLDAGEHPLEIRLGQSERSLKVGDLLVE